MSRSEPARSIVGASFISPVINGAMHIPPAIGATEAALGHGQPVDIPILLVLFSLHVLIDVLDKYADLPSDTRRAWLMSTSIFASPFLGLVAYGTWYCGFMALVRLLAVPMLAVIHAIPLIPWYSWRHRRFSLVKLKYLLGPFKSIFGATCIGLMDTTAIVLYLCHNKHCQAKAFEARQVQILAYTILYDFLWESIADVRDIEEDLHNGVTTLATTFGLWRTLMLLAASTILGDICITCVGRESVRMSASIQRSVFFSGAFSALAVYKPRKAVISWGAGTLVGLLPAWLAIPGKPDHFAGRS